MDDEGFHRKSVIILAPPVTGASNVNEKRYNVTFANATVTWKNVAEPKDGNNDAMRNNNDNHIVMKKHQYNHDRTPQASPRRETNKDQL